MLKFMLLFILLVETSLLAEAQTASPFYNNLLLVKPVVMNASSSANLAGACEEALQHAKSSILHPPYLFSTSGPYKNISWTKLQSTVSGALASGESDETLRRICVDNIEEQLGESLAEASFINSAKKQVQVMHSPLVVAPNTIQQSVMNCQEIAEDCKNGFPLLKDFYDFTTAYLRHDKTSSQMSLSSSAAIDPLAFLNSPKSKTLASPESTVFKEKCNCIEEQLEKDYKDFKTISLKSDLLSERDKVNKKILEAFGKKFLNEYASNLEDMSFFLERTAGMFGNEAQKENAKKLQCNDAKEYVSATAKKCGHKDQNDVEKRMNLFLTSLDSDKNQLRLEERLKRIDEDVLQITSNGKSLTRTQFNELRHGFSRNPQVKLSEKLISKILTNENYNQILSKFLNSGKSPLEAMVLTLDKIKKDDSEAFKKGFLTKRMLGRGHLEEFKKSGEEAISFLQDKLTYTMGVHPGFSLALSNEVIFKKLREKVGSNKRKDIIQLLEKNNEILPLHLEQRCQKLINQFAEASCTPPDELIGKLDQNNLEAIFKDIQEEGKEIDPRVHSLLLCKSTGKTSGNSAFRDLDPDGRSRTAHSDYWERKTLPPEEHKNAFSIAHKALTLDKSPIKKTFSKAAGLSHEWKESVSSRGVASQDVFKNAERLGKTVSFDQSSSKVLRSEERVSESSFRSETQAVSQPSSEASFRESSTTSIPQITPVIPNVAAAAIAPTPQSDIANFLTRDSNREEVRKHLANMDEKSLNELNRIREESLRDQEKLLELSSKNEELKLRALQKKVQELMDKKNEIERPAIASKAESKEEREDIENVRSFSPGYSKPSRQSSGPEHAPAAMTRLSGATAAQGARHNSSRGKSPSLNGSKSDTIPVSSKAGAIIIESYAIKKNQSADSQDLGQEVISYLKKSKADLSILQQIKEKGMIYKFKALKNGAVVEQEVLVTFDKLTQEAREFIEKRIAEGYKKDQKELNAQIAIVQREHSFQALKLIIGEQLQKK